MTRDAGAELPAPRARGLDLLVAFDERVGCHDDRRATPEPLQVVLRERRMDDDGPRSTHRLRRPRDRERVVLVRATRRGLERFGASRHGERALGLAEPPEQAVEREIVEHDDTRVVHRQGVDVAVELDVVPDLEDPRSASAMRGSMRGCSGHTWSTSWRVVKPVSSRPARTAAA